MTHLVLDPPRAVVSPPIQWVMPPRFDEAAARAFALRCATVGPTRPADAGARVDVTGARSFFLPFWRTELHVEGWKVDVGEEAGFDRGYGFHRPRTEIRVGNIDRRSTLSVCARRSFRGELFGARLRILPSSVVARDAPGELELAKAPVLDADVDWPEADEWARKLATSRLTNSDTVISHTKAKTYAMQFVWVPIWWVDYRYAGEANPSGEGSFLVAFTANDQVLLHAKHPSGVRAVMKRLRGLLSFDKSALDGVLRKPRERG